MLAYPPFFFKKLSTEYQDKAKHILSNIGLDKVANNYANEISYGQQKLLTIGCCIANDAKLLLLDEPVAGIDKYNFSKIYELIITMKNEGKTILQIEHNHKFIRELSDGIWFLNSGKAFLFSDYNSFINNNNVKENYLI